MQLHLERGATQCYVHPGRDAQRGGDRRDDQRGGRRRRRQGEENICRKFLFRNSVVIKIGGV